MLYVYVFLSIVYTCYVHLYYIRNRAIKQFSDVGIRNNFMMRDSDIPISDQWIQNDPSTFDPSKVCRIDEFHPMVSHENHNTKNITIYVEHLEIFIPWQYLLRVFLIVWSQVGMMFTVPRMVFQRLPHIIYTPEI